MIIVVALCDFETSLVGCYGYDMYKVKQAF